MSYGFEHETRDSEEVASCRALTACRVCRRCTHMHVMSKIEELYIIYQYITHRVAACRGELYTGI